MSDFDAFWSAYPRKVGKLAAMGAYQKALRLASPADILAGVENYRRNMPDEPRYICHAATWLNAGRWMDEYDTPVQRELEICPHTPECHNKAWCRVVEARKRGEVA